ncbi:MAG TPA: hypothetical protein VHV78_06675, partial [Gemmatimonadaceae bacterium]|nr:hypothetical protein [Gemmatimonadaceae bacterium]
MTTRSAFRRYGFVALLATLSAVSAAQTPDSTPDSTPARWPSTPPISRSYWEDFGLGAVTSILAHELGHIGTSLALGKHPTIGLNEFRPTIYSGIILAENPREQFWFSAAGLNVQSVIDEAILDIPHW